MPDGKEQMMARIRQNAELAFGRDGAQEWLKRSWRVFDHKTPLEMAGHDGERVLRYVEHFIADDASA